MSYFEWVKIYLDKLEIIFNKIKGKSVAEVIEYFEYDNISKTNNDFCPLFRDFTKCHSTNKLNCLLCACPHFIYSDKKPIFIREDGVRVMGVCNIGSKSAKTFINNKIGHCDCSECIIPHKSNYVKTLMKDVEDGYSILEHIRNYQLESSFGKFKLFDTIK